MTSPLSRTAARWRPAWRPTGELADRLVVLAAAMVAFKVSNFPFISEHVPGRTALLANLVLEYVAFLIFCVLVALALRRPLPRLLVRWRPHRLLWMSPLFAALALLVVGVTVARPMVRGTELIDDANAMAVCGARAMASGGDPYQVAEIPCLQSQNLPATLATPLREGPLRGVAVYPTAAQIEAAATTPGRGGQLLFSPLGKPPLTPAVMVPVSSLPVWARTAWTLLPILGLLVALVVAAGPLWPAVGGLFLLTLFLNGSAVNFAANGNAEAWAYALMALAVIWIRRPVISAVCLALAVGSNQLAWFFLPGYLLLALELGGWPRRIVAGGVTLIATVVPFLVVYPDALRTVFGNLRAHTFPLGSGPISLALANFVPVPSRTLLLGLTAALMVVVWLTGAISWRWRWAAGVLVLAPFWVSWRSLDEYLAQIPLLALATLVAMYGSSTAHRVAGSDRYPGTRVASPSVEGLR